MIILKAHGGGIGRRFRQPFFIVPRSVPTFEAGTIGALARSALALGVLLLVAATASAVPARLLRVRFSGDCDAFTVVVSGEGLNQPSPTVSYNIILTPHTGEPMAIVDSFAVTPEKDGKFHKKVHGTWKTFEFTLTDAFTLSGSAILTSGLTLLHTKSITFPSTALSCKSKKMGGRSLVMPP